MILIPLPAVLYKYFRGELGVYWFLQTNAKKQVIPVLI